jgi:predicted enzyme related to lactoylglutathione lyase
MIPQRKIITVGTVAVVLATAALYAGFCPRGYAAEVPPLTTPASNDRLVGKFIWVDLETTDLAGARRFYHALFGWEYRDYRAYGVDYTVAMVGGNPVAGLLRQPVVRDSERHSVWLPFFSVANVRATFELAGKAHAGVRSAPQSLPQRGTEARLTDPEGAMFALLTSSSGDPADDPNPRALGTWGSPSLLARDPGREAVFYQGLFQYAVLGEPASAGFERVRLSSGSYERADIRPLPGSMSAMPAQWVSFIRVFSVADTSQQAVSLGGRIVVAEARASRGASSVILADPSGAVFGIVELPPEVAQRNLP